MSARSDEYVDGLILSFAQVRWRKVAMIMSQVLHECRRGGRDDDLHDVAEHVRALVEDGQLEARGPVHVATQRGEAAFLARSAAFLRSPDRGRSP